MIRPTAKSIRMRWQALRPGRGTVLAALLTIPFGLYYVADRLPGLATTAMLGLFGVLMFIVLLEG